MNTQDVAGIFTASSFDSGTMSTGEKSFDAYIKGGSVELAKYISNRLDHSGAWSEYGVKGKIQLAIKLDSDGTVKEVFCIKSIHGDLDTQIIELVKAFNGFVPTTVAGKPVAGKYLLNLRIE